MRGVFQSTYYKLHEGDCVKLKFGRQERIIQEEEKVLQAKEIMSKGADVGNELACVYSSKRGIGWNVG